MTPEEKYHQCLKAQHEAMILAARSEERHRRQNAIISEASKHLELAGMLHFWQIVAIAFGPVPVVRKIDTA